MAKHKDTTPRQKEMRARKRTSEKRSRSQTSTSNKRPTSPLTRLGGIAPGSRPPSRKKLPPVLRMVAPQEEERRAEITQASRTYSPFIAATRWPREVSLARVVERKHMGDLDGLAKSIDARGGLLQPIVITEANELIAGQRRLAAWERSRFCKEPIPVHVMPSIDSILAGEWDENAQRKEFAPSESVALMDALLPEAKRKAEERMRAGKKSPEAGQALDHLAEYLGRDRKTISKAKDVVEAAKQDPEKFGPLLEAMDRSGKVNGPWRRLQVLNQFAEIKRKQASGELDLPVSKYDRMVADMPWPHEADDPRPAERGRATHDYPTMAIDEMCAMPIGRRAAKDCVLYFWTPNFHVESAYKVMRAWGFREFPTIITWAKDAVGRGQRLRSATEQCIVAIKGKPTWHLTNQTTLLCGPVRAESQKPDEFYALIDELTPTAQRSLELFPRRTLPKGWDGYGDQVGKFKRVEGQDEASLLIVLDAIDAGEPIWFSDKLGAWQRFYTGKRKLKLTRPGRQQLAVLREQKEERERKEVDHDRARLHQRGVKLGHDITNTFDPTGALTHEIATCSCGWTCALPLTASAERGKLLPIEEAKDAHLREMIAAAEAGKNVEQRSNKARRARARVGAPAEPQEERKFPDGMAGHVVAMTREYPGDGTPPLSVATCQCGWQSKQPVPDHELQDAAIDAHWQAIADETDAGAQSNLALQAAE